MIISPRAAQALGHAPGAYYLATAARGGLLDIRSCPPPLPQGFFGECQNLQDAYQEALIQSEDLTLGFTE